MQILKSSFKTYLLLLLLSFFMHRQANACDACSAAPSSFNPDFAGFQKKHSLSFVNQIRLYEMNMTEEVHIHGGQQGYPEVQHLHFNTKYEERHFNYELRGVYYPHPRIALAGILPVVQKKLLKDGTVLENQTGLGDALVNVQYHVVNRLENDSVRTQNRLSIGGGIKLPTGRFNMQGYDGTVEPKRQPGTGSADFLFNVQHIFMVKNFGTNTFASYKVNTKNRNDFKFANSFNTSLKVFYEWKIKSFGLIPNTGIAFDHAGKDRQNGEQYKKDSGGMMVSNSFGLDFYFKNFGLNLNYNLPVYQKLEGMQFENKHQFLAGIRYVFEDRYARKKI